MKIDPAKHDEIAKLIHSETSPVGIDAKETHILIIQMLQQMQEQLDDLKRDMELIKTLTF